MKKQGVKRGDSVHRNYVASVIASEEAREHQHWWRSRQLVLDCMTIAFGQLVTEDLEREDVFELQRKLTDRYMKLEHDVAYAVTDESAEAAMNKDKVGSIWCSMDAIDRMIKEYVAPEDFLAFDDRYNENRVQPLTNKDETILALQRLVRKRDDEITRLKSQLKLQKIAKENRNG